MNTNMDKENKENQDINETKQQDDVVSEQNVPEENIVRQDGMIFISEEDLNKFKQQEQQVQVLADRCARLQAEFDNARKRWHRDRAEIVKYASEDLVCNLLNIVDDLERSLELSQQKHEDFTAFLKGVEMILAHLHDLLKKNGVVPMEAKGKKFDPNFHEPLLQVENDEVEENTVLAEMQKGYTLNGKVIRTAKVQVSKKTVKG